MCITKIQWMKSNFPSKYDFKFDEDKDKHSLASCEEIVKFRHTCILWYTVTRSTKIIFPAWMVKKGSPPTHTDRTRHTVVHIAASFATSTPDAKLPACMAGNGSPSIHSNRTGHTVVHRVTNFAIWHPVSNFRHVCQEIVPMHGSHKWLSMIFTDLKLQFINNVKLRMI